jgi:hypothetical protein
VVDLAFFEEGIKKCEPPDRSSQHVFQNFGTSVYWLATFAGTTLKWFAFCLEIL